MPAPDQHPRTRITAQLRALRFDAGSVSLNLIATEGRRGAGAVERMADPARLRSWCDGVGVALRAGDHTPECVAALHELRAAGYDVVTAVLHDRLPDKASVALINRLATLGTPAPRLDGTRVVRPALTADELRSLVARDLLDVLGEPSRLRECDSPACRMAYLDNPAGRPRKWCSMQRCGNRAKAEQHRRKLAAG